MTIRSALRQRFGRSSRDAPGSYLRYDTDVDLRDLSNRLGTLRGRNITMTSAEARLPPNRDAIMHMSNAARDSWPINRTVEDKIITDLSTYRRVD